MARPNPIAGALDAAKARLYKRGENERSDSQAYRPDVLYKNPQAIGERYSYAIGRFTRILQGLGKSSDVTKSVAGAEYPELAREALELYVHFFMDRHKPRPLVGIDRNPFRGLSDKDASRMFIRKVEDIADRSTGKMGPWYAGISVTGAARNR